MQLRSFGASTVNLEEIVESQNQLDLRSEKDKCLALFFSNYQVSKASIVQVSHRVLTVFFLYKLTVVKMIA